jgi:hypothetical protein
VTSAGIERFARIGIHVREIKPSRQGLARRDGGLSVLREHAVELLPKIME